MAVRKGVILAAGYSTRFLPATKSVPKEMLPLLDRPVIQHVVEDTVAAGLKRIVVLTAVHEYSIEKYFERDPVLERELEATGEMDQLREVRRLSDVVEIAFALQNERRDTGDAAKKCGRWWVRRRSPYLPR